MTALRRLPGNVMTDAYVIVTDDTMIVSCWKCGEKFDAETAGWGTCDAKLRTLECPDCGSCFCQAPFLYKRRFWSGAPKTLREHPSRFRIPARDNVVPAPASDAGRASEGGPPPRVGGREGEK